MLPQGLRRGAPTGERNYDPDRLDTNAEEPLPEWSASPLRTRVVTGAGSAPSESFNELLNNAVATADPGPRKFLDFIGKSVPSIIWGGAAF